MPKRVKTAQSSDYVSWKEHTAGLYKKDFGFWLGSDYIGYLLSLEKNLSEKKKLMTLSTKEHNPFSKCELWSLGS